MDRPSHLPSAAPQATLVPASRPKEQSGETLELRKPHEMIVLMPRSKRVTLTGRRLYNALLQVAQSRLAAMMQMPGADYMFEAPLPALLRSSGASGEDRTAAKRYLREMRGLEVDWESTAPGDGVKWRGFSMLSEVAIELRHGENWVCWSYPPTLMAALKEPTRWARIDLDILARLGTYTAVALYEICARYRDNPSGLTSRKPVQWWADALSSAPAGSERREWRKFKSERVKEAVADINRETDLEIELIEHKQGRAVVEAQFAVRRKRLAHKGRAGLAAVVDAHLVLRAESLGIREVKLEGLILEFGEEPVRDKLDQLERRSAMQALRGIDNAYSYLRAMLRNGESGDRPLALAQYGDGPGADLAGAQAMATPSATRLEPLPELPPLSPTVAARSTVPSATSDQASTSGRSAPGVLRTAQDEWLARRIAQIKAEFAALDPVQRQPWVDAALADLAAKRLLSAVISRRAAQGDVLHGLLGSVIVRLYAPTRLGPNWDRPDGPQGEE